MTDPYEDYQKYLKHVEKYGESFFPEKKVKTSSKIKISGENGNFIYLKFVIALNYGSNDNIDHIYIEDDTENKQLTNDLNNKELKLHLSGSSLYIDFHTDYYYKLINFDDFEQYEYAKINKNLTIGLLNKDKSGIINKWTTFVNVL